MNKTTSSMSDTKDDGEKGELSPSVASPRLGVVPMGGLDMSPEERKLVCTALWPNVHSTDIPRSTAE